MEISIFGLGAMGGSIARRLVSCSYPVFGYDPSQDACDRAVKFGVRIATDITAAAATADVIITSLPNSTVLSEVWPGILAGARRSTFVLEMSTLEPAAVIEVARQGTDAQLRVLDCPVSGGPAEAVSGSLTLLVGGAEADIHDIRPLLGRIGSSLQYTGECGTAKIVKIVNNLMSMGNVLVAAEAFTIGVSAGIDANRLLEILSVSGGSSHHLVKRFPKAVKQDFRPGFKLKLGEKDIGLALDLARSSNIPAPAASLAREMYRIALTEGLADEDIVAILKVYGTWASRQRDS